MDLIEQIDTTLSAPWATEEDDLVYRMNIVKVTAKGKKVIEKKPPSIGLAHRLYKTGELLLEKRIERAHRNGNMSFKKKAMLLNACKQSERNDASKLDHLATALCVKNDNPIEGAFTVEQKFKEMNVGWDVISWLEF
jgi:hypothetical protein